jgi:MoxR-like ATPase
MFKVNVEFPSVDDLMKIVERTTGASEPQAGKIADGRQIVRMGQLALETPVASQVNRYVAHLVASTHPATPGSPEIVRKYVRYGASPRGAQALIIGVKVNALLDGRFNVAFEDIHAVARHALRHRILLNFEGLAENISTDEIVEQLSESVARLPV